jgi:ubiquinone biosynthesis protein COQ9
MGIPNYDIKTNILMAALPSVPFDGWTQKMLEEAALSCGYPSHMVRAVFPEGVSDAIRFFSRWADEQMMDRLTHTDVKSMRIRDRIEAGVLARLHALAPYKEAERLAVAYWMRPFRKWEGGKLVWKTADRIWEWAGDEATDYNRYTKRGLLSGVLVSTVLFWLDDASKNHADTKGFLSRRIENVLKIGKVAAKFKTA